MEPTLMLELGALVAVIFEVVKRYLQGKFSEKTGDYVFRGLLIVFALGAALINRFYVQGHPEIVKVATQIAVSAAGIWALLIKLLPNKNSPAALNDADKEAN